LFPDEVVLFDWNLAIWAPGEVEVAWFLTYADQQISMPREAFVELYRAAVGPLFSDRAMRLAWVGGLMLMGWEKALRVIREKDSETRSHAQLVLDCWVTRARECFDDVWSPE
jgi:hypothetical protein